MVETGSRFGLEHETLQRLRRGEFAAQYHLKGNRSIHADLPGTIDHTHSSTSDLVQDFVIAKTLAQRRRSCRSPVPGGGALSD